MNTKLLEDIIPITDLMHKSKEIIAKLKKNKRPLLVTQHGRAAMICMDVAEYERQQRQNRLIEFISVGI